MQLYSKIVEEPTVISAVYFLCLSDVCCSFHIQYATVHRLETNKLRNVAKFYAQLFYCDALPWTGMSCIHLNEEETNSSRSL